MTITVPRSKWAEAQLDDLRKLLMAIDTEASRLRRLLARNKDDQAVRTSLERVQQDRAALLRKMSHLIELDQTPIWDLGLYPH